jgi:ABC-type phosphate/phosphonate transport system substrate-binding protein
MTARGRFTLAILAALGGLAVAAASEKEANIPTDGVRIAMVRTLFRDTPESLIRVMMQPFAALMESQTGLPGKLVSGGDAAKVGQMLAEDKVHIGVFHGVEFAWARQKYPEIKPLMIAVNQSRILQAFIVVRGDAAPASLADLKGKTLALPRCTREHCHLFLEHRCQECGLEPSGYFSTTTLPPTIEDALDDVVDNIVQAALVDGVGLKCYERRKPARFAQLKTIASSEIFPAAVVAYHPGTLDDATLTRFREGMINANKGALGRQFMTLWRLTAFEPVPTDYEQTLADILKTYPVPPAKAPAKGAPIAAQQASD